MKVTLLLAGLLSFSTLAFARVGKIECNSNSASISLLEEFGGNGYKVILAKVAVSGSYRSGFDVLFPNQRQLPGTLFTAALPGFTVSLTLPARTELAFPTEESTIVGQIVVNGGTPESAACLASRQ